MFRLAIETDNAAFGENDLEKTSEVCRILKAYIKNVENRGDLAQVNLRDINGNKVGEVSI